MENPLNVTWSWIDIENFIQSLGGKVSFTGKKYTIKREIFVHLLQLVADENSRKVLLRKYTNA